MAFDGLPDDTYVNPHIPIMFSWPYVTCTPYESSAILIAYVTELYYKSKKYKFSLSVFVSVGTVEGL